MKYLTVEIFAHVALLPLINSVIPDVCLKG